jgi:hypothetical protein
MKTVETRNHSNGAQPKSLMSRELKKIRMSNFSYKCVPVPDVVITGKKGKDLHAQAVSTYEKIINDAASGGWELVNIDTITSYQQPGCFAGLFGSKPEAVTFKLLVFKKPI